MELAMLGLEGESHPRLDLYRVVERPDPRDHRRIVLREAEAMAPEVGRCLILLRVSPDLLRRWPLGGDVLRRRAGLHGFDRVPEPLVGLVISPLHLVRRLATDAVRPVHASLEAVPRERGEIDDHKLPWPDDPIGKVAPVWPGVWARGNDDVLDVFHSWDRVEVLETEGCHFVLHEPGLEEVGELVVERVADRADDLERFDLIGALDGASFHHRAHPVGPFDARSFEGFDHVDVDEVDPERLVRHPGRRQVGYQRLRELIPLRLSGWVLRSPDLRIP